MPTIKQLTLSLKPLLAKTLQKRISITKDVILFNYTALKKLPQIIITKMSSLIQMDALELCNLTETYRITHKYHQLY